MSKKKHTIKKQNICIHDDVMKQIHDENIHMRPKLHFVTGSALLGVGMAGAVIVAGFFTNIMIYKLRYDDAFGYLDFGSPGIRPFVLIFPWKPLLIAFTGLIGGLVLLRKYDISYKRSFTGLVIGAIALTATMGVLLDKTGANEKLHEMHAFRKMYNGQKLHKPWIVGVVDEIQKDRVLIITPYKDKVLLNVRRIEAPVNKIIVGQKIKAIGEWNDDVFVVKYIRGGTDPKELKKVK